MLTKYYYDRNGLVRQEEAVPVCGEDFRDTCGDCLRCYDDECFYGGLHFWVKYID